RGRRVLVRLDAEEDRPPRRVSALDGRATRYYCPLASGGDVVAAHGGRVAGPLAETYAAWIGESAARSGCSRAGGCGAVAAEWFFATSTARLSRITVTFTWPG